MLHCFNTLILREPYIIIFSVLYVKVDLILRQFLTLSNFILTFMFCNEICHELHNVTISYLILVLLWFDLSVFFYMGRYWFPKVLFMGSKQINELLRWNFNEARSHLLRNTLDGLIVLNSYWRNGVQCYVYV